MPSDLSSCRRRPTVHSSACKPGKAVQGSRGVRRGVQHPATRGGSGSGTLPLLLLNPLSNHLVGDGQVGRATIEPDPIRLSNTKAFHWRRDHAVCGKSVFNYVATFDSFESSFAKFVDGCDDVLRFAALAEFFTGFWVDYVKPSGATGRYFPDWVVVQQVHDGEANWIIETKGRVWEGTDRKDAAIRHWCEQVTASTGESWRYMRVDQSNFEPDTLASFGNLVTLIEQRAKAMEHQVIVVPGSGDRET